MGIACTHGSQALRYGALRNALMVSRRPVALNSELAEAEMERRLAGAWRPYHRRLAGLAADSPCSTLVFAIHTFTERFLPGEVRATHKA